MKVQLICEGGGMRGIYTSGVLDYFLEKNLRFEDTIGVSAGACNLINYASNQKGRQANLYLNYSHTKKYLSLSNYVKTGSLLGFDYVFRELADKDIPYDFEGFKANNVNVYVGITNIVSGICEFYKINDAREQIDYLIASCSLPLICKIVDINSNKYLDGGLGEAIPINSSIKMGFDKQVVILTRDKEYRKTISSDMALKRVKYKKYPNLIKTLENRHIVYNNTLEFLDELEKNKKVFIIRPSEKMNLERLKNSNESLTYYYNLGYNDAKNKYEELSLFIKDAENISTF